MGKFNDVKEQCKDALLESAPSPPIKGSRRELRKRLAAYFTPTAGFPGAVSASVAASAAARMRIP